MKETPKIAIITVCLILMIGCAPASNPSGMSTLGAVGIGAGVGAGAGALVGSAISDGDILASAGLGAAIGAGGVLIARYAYRKHHENKEIDDNNDVIKSNYDLIKANELDMDEFYRHLNYESKGIEPTDEVNRYFEG